jgi:integrase
MAKSDTKFRNAKPMEKPYKLSDELGLYLLVNPVGSKYWRLKFRLDSVEKLFALGVYPDVSLETARARRDAARVLIAQGINPVQAKHDADRAKQAATVDTFEALAREWWANWKGDRTERHADYVLRRLEADVFPAIGKKPIATIRPRDVIAVARAIEKRGALDIAKRALETIGQVFRYAIQTERVDTNPAANLSGVVKARPKTNYARLTEKELPELMGKIANYSRDGGALVTRIALQLMALTFVRTSELIAARWEEFDFERAQWRIPAERMKMREPHIVPLTKQALALLAELKVVTGHSVLLFPGERDHAKPMSNNTLLFALYRMGYHSRMTGHGFRGIASTQLHEMGFDHNHIELQLAHKERNAVSAAYNHATYLPQRAKMMQFWADYLDQVTTGKVIAGKFGKAA